MAEKPILFSGEMVRAILDGRKTQTRRVMGVQPLDLLPMNIPNEWVALVQRDPERGKILRCKYGVPGDRLWVRETWAAHPTRNKTKPSNLPVGIPIWYQQNEGVEKGHFVWRPSIFMPRWASRITLEIERVTAQKLQDITERSARQEGVMRWASHNPENNGYTFMFRQLWDSLNAKREFGWDVNPWVWAIEFKRVEVNHG